MVCRRAESALATGSARVQQLEQYSVAQQLRTTEFQESAAAESKSAAAALVQHRMAVHQPQVLRTELQEAEKQFKTNAGCRPKRPPGKTRQMFRI